VSARSAGRIAAITTGKSLGVPVVGSGAERAAEAVIGPEGGPLIPQVEPGAVIGAGERAGLATIVSYVPSEALTIYLAGIACVNLVQSTDTGGQKVAAAWVLFVIAVIANAAFVWLAFRDKFADFSRRELTVRQTRPLAAALVITTLAFFVFSLAIPGGIFISASEWLPLILLIGTAVTIGVARVAGLAPLQEDPPAE
jgi:hypothetical protein